MWDDAGSHCKRLRILGAALFAATWLGGCGGGSGGSGDTGNDVPEPTVIISANPTSVTAGGSATLAWSSTNAASCTAGGAWTGDKALSGTQSTGAIDSPSTYTLTCTGSGRSVSQSVTVAVIAAPEATVTLTATPNRVTSGETTLLIWSSQNATSCNAWGAWSGQVTTSGSVNSSALTAPTNTFSLTCVGPSGTASASVTVLVDTPPSPQGSYSTNFDLTEYPISENGAWHRWSAFHTDVRTENGIAHGTNGATDSYDDSYALLSGFGPDQTAEAVVYRSSNLVTGVTHEVELLLRFTDDPSGARGYECLFAYFGAVQIFRWNAPNNFTAIPSTSGPGNLGRELVTGDIVKASIVGNVISLYINGALMARGTDSAITSGQPGIGFFTRPGGNSAHLGLTSYTVTSN